MCGAVAVRVAARGDVDEDLEWRLRARVRNQQRKQASRQVHSWREPKLGKRRRLILQMHACSRNSSNPVACSVGSYPSSAAAAIAIGLRAAGEALGFLRLRDADDGAEPDADEGEDARYEAGRL